MRNSTIITSFEEFNKSRSGNGHFATNENFNLPPGIKDPGEDDDYGKRVEPEVVFDPANNDLKLVVVDGLPATDYTELALLKDRSDNLFLLHFDDSEEKYDPFKERILVGYEFDEKGNRIEEYEYDKLGPDGVEEIANAIPANERGEGIKDMSRKDLVRLDGQAAENFLEELEEIIQTTDAKIHKPYMAMMKAVSEYLS